MIKMELLIILHESVNIIKEVEYCPQIQQCKILPQKRTNHIFSILPVANSHQNGSLRTGQGYLYQNLNCWLCRLMQSQWKVVSGSIFRSYMRSECDKRTIYKVVKIGQSLPSPILSSSAGRCPPMLSPFPLASWMWICGCSLQSMVPDSEVISMGPSTQLRKELLANLSQQDLTLPTADAMETAVSWQGAMALVMAVIMSWLGCSLPERVSDRLKYIWAAATWRIVSRRSVGSVLFIIDCI